MKRIMVALDASTHSLAALEAAATIAGRLNSELVGLFVEDINLIRLSRIPRSTEVGYPSALACAVDRRHLEDTLRHLAAQARQSFIQEAERRGLPWSFQVVRGTVTRELLTAARDVDLVAIGRCGSGNLQKTGFGSTTTHLLQHSLGPLLVLQRGCTLHPPILTVFQDSDDARRAMDIGLRLAPPGLPAGHITVVWAPPELQRRVRTQAERIARKTPAVTTNTLVLRHPCPGDFVRMVHQTGAGALLIPASNPLASERTLHILTDYTPCPVVVIR